MNRGNKMRIEKVSQKVVIEGQCTSDHDRDNSNQVWSSLRSHAEDKKDIVVLKRDSWPGCAVFLHTSFLEKFRWNEVWFLDSLLGVDWGMGGVDFSHNTILACEQSRLNGIVAPYRCKTTDEKDPRIIFEEFDKIRRLHVEEFHFYSEEPAMSFISVEA